ncbi:MAG: serine--tRNA ligase [Bdellovibrionales bacterium]
MIDLKWLHQKSEEGVGNAEEYRKNLIDRGMSGKEVDELLALDEKRKSSIHNFETKKAEQKKASQEFGAAKKKGQASDDLLAKMQNLSKDVKDLEVVSHEAQEEMEKLIHVLPNRLDEGVPSGKSEDENVLFREWGEKREHSFKSKEHWELGEQNGTIDFDRAGKVSGSRFAFLRGDGAKLERALIQFMLDKHTEKHGYEEVFPPLIVGSGALFGTSNFPKFKEDVFKIEGRDGYLIPTAEVPLTNLYAGEILKEEELPKKFTAYTPCFRSEAGSYGKDTKGLIRQHQFNKVEVVKLVHPEKSKEEHLKLLADAESILQDLGLHYQTVELCSGDISFGAMKCFDINVWLPGQQAYREISSCSNFGDFQARRAGIRFKPSEGGKPVLLHTLNGSGLAVGRTLVAIYENYQQEDGSIVVPEVLRKYMGKEII